MDKPIISKAPNAAYDDFYDRVFGSKEEVLQEDVEQVDFNSGRLAVATGKIRPPSFGKGK